MQGKLQQRSGDFNLRTSPFAFLFPPRMNSRLRGWGVSRLRGIAGVSVPGFCWLPFPRSGDFNLRVSPLAFLFPPRMNSRLQGWGYHGCGDGRGFGSGVFAGSLSPVAEISISACLPGVPVPAANEFAATGVGISRLRGWARFRFRGFCWLPFPRSSGDFNLRGPPLRSCSRRE